MWLSHRNYCKFTFHLITKRKERQKEWQRGGDGREKGKGEDQEIVVVVSMREDKKRIV